MGRICIKNSQIKAEPHTRTHVRKQQRMELFEINVQTNRYITQNIAVHHIKEQSSKVVTNRVWIR